MKRLYLTPKTRSVFLQVEAFFCQSGMDKGDGIINPVTELDLNDDEWSSIY